MEDVSRVDLREAGEELCRRTGVSVLSGQRVGNPEGLNPAVCMIRLLEPDRLPDRVGVSLLVTVNRVRDDFALRGFPVDDTIFWIRVGLDHMTTVIAGQPVGMFRLPFPDIIQPVLAAIHAAGLVVWRGHRKPLAQDIRRLGCGLIGKRDHGGDQLGRPFVLCLVFQRPADTLGGIDERIRNGGLPGR
jgi:hypothetical protein